MDLIASAYDNSSDDEDSDPWASSRVSTKRTFGENDELSRPFKKLTSSKLPTPQLNVKVETCDVMDNPALHGNRIRSFPHERGNWASFVYLPWQADAEFLQAVHSTIAYFEVHHIKLTICEDFHVSLSRTVVLRHHWIESFISSVQRQLGNANRSQFQLIGTAISVYVNDENTRTFIAFLVEDLSGTIAALVEAVDTCMAEFQLPTFYKDSSYHVSVAWCVGNKKKEIEELAIQFSLERENISCVMEKIMCKVGHLSFSHALI